MRISPLALVVLTSMNVLSYAQSSPTLVHIGPVSPNIVEIVIRAGRVMTGTQKPYVKQDGDEIREGRDHAYLYRQGKKLGVLIGEDQDILCPFDMISGSPLKTPLLDDPHGYWIRSSDDARYRRPQHPTAVHRKQRPTDIARTDDWKFQAPIAYHLFVVFPSALQSEASYTLTLREIPITPITLHYKPQHLRSEAVHVSHLGFHPGDPAKLAFLSCWMGHAGGLVFPEHTQFHILDDETHAQVYSGFIQFTKPPSLKDEDAYKRNFNLTPVYELDFSTLRKPGKYRIYVEGVGCSFPWRIHEDVWKQAFRTGLHGFYHQRSGIPLEPPHTSFQRPRSFHPDDGVRVYASTTRLMDTRNGLSDTDPDNFRNLVAGRTQTLVENAWGGYMDAGDWDRRIQHLIASIYLLDLAEYLPAFIRQVNTNIPESGNALPDVVDEALFNLDAYRRMQTPEGGIRGGIESAEHPRLGEASWQESLTIMAYAPGSWSSFYYAGVAAKAAHVLKSFGQASLAQTYEDSALRAMTWAERDYAQRGQRVKSYRSRGIDIERMDDHIDVRDKRNYAAAELYRLTGAVKWHQVFLQTTKLNQANAQLYVWKSHEQREAAWTYLNTESSRVDRALQQSCKQALLREAEDRLRTQSRTGFRWTKNDWAPPTATLSASDTVSLVRAHILTQASEYLRALVLACQTGLGANPLNLCYTTGLGRRWPKHPLHLDSRLTGQAPPAGLTVFGPVDPTPENDLFLKTVIHPFCHPEPKHWPVMEAYWDVFWYPMMCEFTIHHPMSYNTHAWGYLAGLSR